MKLIRPDGKEQEEIDSLLIGGVKKIEPFGSLKETSLMIPIMDMEDGCWHMNRFADNQYNADQLQSIGFVVGCSVSLEEGLFQKIDYFDRQV